jgi:hypothetical protein
MRTTVSGMSGRRLAMATRPDAGMTGEFDSRWRRLLDEVPCADCGVPVRPNPEIDFTEEELVGMHCDDCFFDRIGDMLTPDELRRLELRKPENAERQAKWLAEYQAAGIADDQDPSSFTLEVPAGTPPDEIPKLAAEAMRLRFSTAEDFAA